jgi:hypothetical protein
MTWELINLIWPGGWEVMGRKERGTMVNGPFGDSFDVLLQNAPSSVLNSYPCLLLSGDIRLSAAEVERFTHYVQKGGTLILNTAYLRDFPQYAKLSAGNAQRNLTDGKGRVIWYGPDFRVDQLPPILREQLTRCLPVTVSPGVEFAVNILPEHIWVTLINNEGVTKEPRKPAVIDATQSRTVSVSYQGRARVRSVADIKNQRAYVVQKGREVSVNLSAGEVVILEFRLH